MTKKRRIIVVIGVIISGLLLNAFAWTTKLGHPISTIALFLGLGLFFVGMIQLILSLTKK